MANESDADRALREHIRRTAEAMPPLTPAERERLARLLSDDPDQAIETAEAPKARPNPGRGGPSA